MWARALSRQEILIWPQARQLAPQASMPSDHFMTLGELLAAETKSSFDSLSEDLYRKHNVNKYLTYLVMLGLKVLFEVFLSSRARENKFNVYDVTCYWEKQETERMNCWSRGFLIVFFTCSLSLIPSSPGLGTKHKLRSVTAFCLK